MSASSSSTTRSATWVAPRAAIGKWRIGLPSRKSTTLIICSVELPPRKYTGCVVAPPGTTYRSVSSSGTGLS